MEWNPEFSNVKNILYDTENKKYDVSENQQFEIQKFLLHIRLEMKIEVDLYEEIFDRHIGGVDDDWMGDYNDEQQR